MPAWESAVGQYRSLGCQRGAFHWEGQFHPPWELIAGIRGGGEVGGRRGGRKLKGKGGGFEEGQFLEEMEVYEGACGGNLK